MIQEMGLLMFPLFTDVFWNFGAACSRAIKAGGDFYRGNPKSADQALLGERAGWIAPYAPAGKRGHPPFSVETLLRIHFLQQWFGLSDAAMEETLYDLPLYRVFSGTDVFEDQRSAAREGVDAAFGYGRRCRADQRAEFDPEPAQGGRPRNASDQERPAGVLWDESAHRRGRRLWPCAPVRGTAAHVQALHPR